MLPLPGLGDPAARAAEPERRDGRHPAAHASARWPTLGSPRAPARRRRERARRPPAARARASPSSSRSSSTVGRRGYELSALSPRASSSSPTRASTWSPAAASSRCAAASSTSSPPDAEHPVRAEFFGDELEQLRAFSVADQRSLPGELTEHRAVAEPRAAAHRLGPAARPRDAGSSSRPSRACSRRSPRASRSRGWSRSPRRCSSASCRSPTTCPADAAIAILSPERVSTRALSLAETNREFLEAAWSAATAGAAGADRPRRRATSSRSARCGPHPAPAPGGRSAPSTSDDEDVLRLEAEPVPSFAGQAEGAADHVVGAAARRLDGRDRRPAATASSSAPPTCSPSARSPARAVDEFPADPEPGSPTC